MRGRKMRNIFFRTVSLVLMLTFPASNVSFASMEQDIGAPEIEENMPLKADDVAIAIDCGNIRSKYSGNNGKTIIHIQDAHCNYEAQSNINRILEQLTKECGVDMISVEGAEGLVDTAWFKAFPDEEIRKEVADYFMKKGEITGAEFFSITTDYNGTIFGAETRDYYIKNLKAFTKVYPYKEATEKYLKDTQSVANRLKAIIYTPKLKELDGKIQAFAVKELELSDYAEYLDNNSKKLRIDLKDCPNFNKLLQTLEFEDKIDFDIVDQERSRYIDDLSKKLSKEQMTELVGESVRFKKGHIKAVDFYTYLRELAKEHNIDIINEYPNLFYYHIYTKIYDGINNEQLFKEIDIVKGRLKEKFFKDDTQRTLDKYSTMIDMYVALTNIELTNDDYDIFKEYSKDALLEDILVYLNGLCGKYNLNCTIGDAPAEIIQNLPSMIDFYEIAMERDRVLIANTLEQMQEEGKDRCVFIAGGFHTRGIKNLLEEKGVSYVVVTPKITKDVETPYIKVLTNQRTSLEDIITESAMPGSGVTVHGENVTTAKNELMGPVYQFGLLINSYLRDPQYFEEFAQDLDEAILGKVPGAIPTEEKTEESLKETWEMFVKKQIAKWEKNKPAKWAKVLEDIAADPEKIVEIARSFNNQCEQAAGKKSKTLPALITGLNIEIFKRIFSSPSGQAVGTGLSIEQNEALAVIIRQSIAEGTYSEFSVPLPGGKEFTFMCHDGLKERIEAHNAKVIRTGEGVLLPLDLYIHPGRGGAEMAHALTQGHMDTRDFMALEAVYGRSTLTGDPLMRAADHEMAHFRIMAFESMTEAERSEAALTDADGYMIWFEWKNWLEMREIDRPTVQDQENFLELRKETYTGDIRRALDALEALRQAETPANAWEIPLMIMTPEVDTTDILDRLEKNLRSNERTKENYSVSRSRDTLEVAVLKGTDKRVVGYFTLSLAEPAPGISPRIYAAFVSLSSDDEGEAVQELLQQIIVSPDYVSGLIDWEGIKPQKYGDQTDEFPGMFAANPSGYRIPVENASIGAYAVNGTAQAPVLAVIFDPVLAAAAREFNGKMTVQEAVEAAKDALPESATMAQVSDLAEYVKDRVESGAVDYGVPNEVLVNALRLMQITVLSRQPVLMPDVGVAPYAWAGTGIVTAFKRFVSYLTGKVTKIAEIWFNSSVIKNGRDDTPSLFRDTGIIIGLTRLPEVKLREVLEAAPELVSAQGYKNKPFFVKLLNTRFPNKVYMGFNSNIEGNGKEEFKQLAAKERENMVALKDALKADMTENEWNEYLEVYEQWAREQSVTNWTLDNDAATISEFAKYVKPADQTVRQLFDEIKATRANMVGYLNVIDLSEDLEKLKDGAVILSPTGYPHGIFGLSLQSHPREGGKEYPKNEAWYVKMVKDADGKDSAILVEIQQTSNVTYSFADFFTPIVAEKSKDSNYMELSMRKKDSPGKIKEYIETTLDQESTVNDDFIRTPVPAANVQAVNAGLDVLIKGTSKVWRRPFFEVYRGTFNGGRANPASLKPAARQFVQDVIVLEGSVTISPADRPEQKYVLGKGESALIPAGSEMIFGSTEKSEILMVCGEEESYKAIGETKDGTGIGVTIPKDEGKVVLETPTGYGKKISMDNAREYYLETTVNEKADKRIEAYDRLMVVTTEPVVLADILSENREYMLRVEEGVLEILDENDDVLEVLEPGFQYKVDIAHKVRSAAGESAVIRVAYDIALQEQLGYISLAELKGVTSDLKGKKVVAYMPTEGLIDGNEETPGTLKWAEAIIRKLTSEESDIRPYDANSGLEKVAGMKLEGGADTINVLIAPESLLRNEDSMKNKKVRDFLNNVRKLPISDRAIEMKEKYDFSFMPEALAWGLVLAAVEPKSVNDRSDESSAASRLQKFMTRFQKKDIPREYLYTMLSLKDIKENISIKDVSNKDVKNILESGDLAALVSFLLKHLTMPIEPFLSKDLTEKLRNRRKVMWSV